MIKTLFLRFKRLIAFGIVGCVNTLVDFAVYSAMFGLLELEPWVSQIIGYAAGVVCSFILNHTIVFRDGTRKLNEQMILFLLVNGISWALSTLLIGWLTGEGLNAYIAKVLVTVVIMLINYFGYKLLVFRVKPKEGEDKDE